MSMQKSKKTQALDGMEKIGSQVAEAQEPIKAKPPNIVPDGKRVNTPCRIPAQARSQLRDLAYHHHPKSCNAFMIEGLDLMFEKYGLETITEMEKRHATKTA